MPFPGSPKIPTKWDTNKMRSKYQKSINIIRVNEEKNKQNRASLKKVVVKNMSG